MNWFQMLAIGLGIYLAWPMLKTVLSKLAPTAISTLPSLGNTPPDDAWLEMMKRYRDLRGLALKEECYEAVEDLDGLFGKLNILPKTNPNVKSPTGV